MESEQPPKTVRKWYERVIIINWNWRQTKIEKRIYRKMKM